MSTVIDRRNFLQRSAIAGIGLTLTEHVKAFSAAKKEKVRVGMIGVGFRSHEHMGNFLQREDVEIT